MKPNIDNLLELYWEGETSIEDELELQKYFASNAVAEEHRPFQDLFQFYGDQKQISFPSHIIEDKKVVQLPQRSTMRWAAAAIVTILVGAMGWFAYSYNETTVVEDTSVYVVDDPEEALQITKDALALVSSTLNKSKKDVKKNLSGLEKASIFK